jgi:hypothetical protein
MDDTRKENNKEGRLINMAITEEEKKKRREIVEMSFNIVASDFDGIIEPEVINQPYWEQYIKGDITLEELNKAVHNDIASN